MQSFSTTLPLSLSPFPHILHPLQQFGVLLASYVVQQYPLQEALTIVDDILKRLLILTSEIPAHMREDYFTPLLPALVRFCRTFPPLCSKVTRILVELSRVSSVGEQGGKRDSRGLGRHFVGAGGTSVNSEGGLGKTRGKRSFLSAVENTFQELVETAIVKS